MKITQIFILSLLMVMATTGITSCVNDDSDLVELIARNRQGGDTTIVVDTVAIKTIEIDSTALEEPEEIIPTLETDSNYNDYVENTTFTKTVTVVYEGNTVTVTGRSSAVRPSIDGANVTIKSTAKDVEYILSGSSANGSFKVYSDHKFKVELRGLDLTNPNGAAINSQCGKSMYLVLPEGYNNNVCDGATYTTTGVEDMKGTIFSEGQIIFSGLGNLNVKSIGKNGIASDDYIVFRPGNRIYVNASVGHGVRANDGVTILGGVLNIEINGNGYKGINSDSHINVNGGRTTVLTTGDAVIELADTTSCAGVKCDSVMTIAGGTLNVCSSGLGGKGFNVKGNLYLKSGEVNVVTTGVKGISSPKGVKCDSNIDISGGSVYVYSVNDRAVDVLGMLTIADGYATLKRDTKYLVVDYDNAPAP